MGLLASLKRAKRPVPFAEIRTWFPGAYERVSPQAAERKFERDKKALLSLGVPLRYVEDEEGERGYIIDEAQLYLPELQLSEAERAAMVAASALAASGALPYGQSLRLALEKLSASRTGLWSERGPEPKLFERIQDALSARALISFLYRRDEQTEEMVEPYGLLCRRGRWFLVGRSAARDAPERFSLARMSRLSLGKKGAYAIPETFDIQRQPIPMSGEAKEPTEVRFAVRPHRAFMVAREQPEARECPGESASWTVFSLEVFGQQAFFDWLLQRGDQARLLSPAPWVQALRQRIEAWRASLEVRDG